MAPDKKSHVKWGIIFYAAGLSSGFFVPAHLALIIGMFVVTVVAIAREVANELPADHWYPRLWNKIVPTGESGFDLADIAYTVAAPYVLTLIGFLVL